MTLRITHMGRDDFLSLAWERKEAFLRRIAEAEVFVVQRFYDPGELAVLRRRTFEWGQATGASWHPLHDDCPDYHRLHDNYPQAWFKQKLHAFYRHGWYPENRALFAYFEDVFALKNHLAGFDRRRFVDHCPSDGIVARVNVHHYPVGGGYQAEHIDPTGAHAQVQTLIQASRPGVDFASGGVYARASEADLERTYIDLATDMGDMIVMSPAIPHGVDAIDPDRGYEWRHDNGRWIVLPLFLTSDYPGPGHAKPRRVGPDPRR